MTPGRRTLHYHSLDEVVPDVERLLAGHTTVGNWSLAQICRHLATAVRFSVDRPAPAERDLSRYASDEQKREFFESGVIAEGRPMPPGFVVSDSLDDREEADGLQSAISHYKASPSPVIDHPRFGPLSSAEWERFHCIHAAHHFSFAIPVER
jgi:hypothetical protein